ncbi:Stp1/IreP family PP2C-type Ser/Thr phosphatase [Evansella sp. LMS18]|jgi:protein phosphatase|uniref:Stp1/IreP family PP2C-type Ser/Thr phosphatase n=1 Tax=Evansella sp. LMS18 TaxID=2924033 RepID=UPI0020D049EF|nr:Stp1/IreP family PP2C-type Ser/Thr phosphatase [Evansella sp. LMS18]UTR10927.1 Stp1/IreP family PP2C-type Ser/Thr phosphatase [Evansella sp. LMS18]
MEAVFRTDVGKIRSHNEDDGFISEQLNGQMLVLVADGMGGHQAGDVASKMTKDILLEKWQEINRPLNPKEAEKWLEDSIYEVNRRLFEHAQKHPQCKGMGTTLVASICTDQFISHAHVGDSRIYLKSEGQMKQITSDHSLVAELVRSGQISEEEAQNHPRRNVVLRALGTESNIKVDVNTINWDPGALLMLCSDGLTDMLPEEEIYEQITDEGKLEKLAEQLIQMANDRGGEDNITIALIRHTGDLKEVTDR